MSLRVRILLLVLAATLLPAVAMGWLLLEQRHAKLDDARKQLSAQAASFAKDLDDNLTVNLGDRFENIVTEGLREGALDARHVVQGLLHARDQRLLGDIRTPFGQWLQIHQYFDHVNRFGIGAIIGAPSLRNHSGHLRNLQ